MKTFDEFISSSTPGTLYIFDIDETLFKTSAKIHVIDSSGSIVRRLSNSEFNDYDLKRGQRFDFVEFKDSALFNQTSVPIKPMIDRLVKLSINIRSTGTSSKIIMNTARSDFDDKAPVLQKFRDHGIDIDSMHIHRSGNIDGDASPAEKKSVVVRQYLETGDWRRAEMFDDSITNLKSFKALSSEYPNIHFIAWKVDHAGDIKRF